MKTLTEQLQEANAEIAELKTENTELKANITNLTTKTNAKVNGYKLTWGTEFKFPMYSPNQALVIIGEHTAILCWMSGGRI